MDIDSASTRGFSLRRLLSDLTYLPPARWTLPTQAHNYYDNDPFTPAQVALMKQLKMPVMNVNLIYAAVQTVLGLEAKSAPSWVVSADDEEVMNIAEGLNKEFSDIVRLSDAAMTRSAAFKAQFVGGLGWQAVARNPDAFGPPYITENVRRDEMFWDMRSTQPMFSDARWVFRRKMWDIDQIEYYLPAYADVARDALSRYTNDISIWEHYGIPYPSSLDFSSHSAKAMSGGGHPDFFIHGERRQVAVIEGYYWVPRKALVLETMDGVKRELQQDNPFHIFLANDPRTKVYNGWTKTCRQFYYVGPYKVIDRRSPFPFPWAPFSPYIANLRDSDNVPYGPVHNAISPQDRYNDAIIRMSEIMTGRRIVMDSHAIMDKDDAEIARMVRQRTSVFRKTPGSEFRVDFDSQEWQAAMAEMKQAEAEVRAATGIYSTLSGFNENQRSGVAVANLAELANQTIAQTMAGYSMGSRRTGEMLFAMHMQDTENRPRMIVVPGELGTRQKTVEVNTEVTNSLQKLREQFVIKESGRADTFREQQLSQLQILIQSTSQNPQAQQLLVAIWIELQDMPKREKYLKMIQKAFGVSDPENPTQEEQQQAQLQQMLQQIALEKEKKGLGQMDAKIEKDQAIAALNRARADQEGGDAGPPADMGGLKELTPEENDLAERHRMLGDARRRIARNRINSIQ